MTLHLNTFSIVGRCPRRGRSGIATSTALPATADGAP